MANAKKENTYGHILKYTSLFGGIQGLNVLIGLVRNKLVALILGPQGMGLISLFNTSVKLISDSTNLGLSMSGVRSVSEAFESNNQPRLHQTIMTIRLWSLLTALAGVFFAILLSPVLDSWTFNWGDHTLHYVLLSPIVGMMAITGGEMAILKATRHLRSGCGFRIQCHFGIDYVSPNLFTDGRARYCSFSRSHRVVSNVTHDMAIMASLSLSFTF